MIKKNKEFLLIRGEIYPFDVLITTAENQKVYKYIEKKKNYILNDVEKRGLEMTSKARTVQLMGGQVIIRLKKQKTRVGIDLVDLVHEIEHAVWFIFNRIGIKHNDGSDEAFAYFQAYLTRQALNFYDK